MASVRHELLDLIENPDEAYNQPTAELAVRQLQAADELFQQQRGRIAVLRRRAQEAGIESIGSVDDLVPLLFSHTAYKSYPQSFVDQGRWDRMLQWLQTLSADDVTGVDVEGVTDVDDWIDRLEDAGHLLVVTSGTSGKCSFLNHSRADRERKKRHFLHTVAYPHARPDGNRPFFWLGPLTGANSAVEAANLNAAHWARPGAVHALIDEPLRTADISRTAILRRKLADGSATPQEIAEAESSSATKAAQGQEALAKFTDLLLDHRHQPIFLSGVWAQHMMIMERARERGIPDGDFHPDSVVNAGGGIKGIPLPADYREQVAAFYGDVVRPGHYGMSELAQLMPRCEAGRYHRAAGLIILVLDDTGDKALGPEDAGPDGLVRGRFAFLDLAHEGRWGGIITGDAVTADFSGQCACGRSGPTLLDDIRRFAQPGEDDKIGCAGTIDAYIRGAIGA
ncbi:hypothetical protein LO772_31065 [Yinghuangia sp. ASG 101]|uniref:hypothetical protein n=1 Tax=Yinghuangia sp. ASG 101 TaxID=2896848 RepID=UPI001E42D12E|nr:hypothetical protein [Yinghuangia sp. ASG 101]UGQ11195.1 hypothetical protein LO772_31065 [Yinghuangia sp. ASG 101]